MLEKLNEIADIFDAGKVLSFTKEQSSQNNVYKIVTQKGNFIIKEYSHDAIKNYYQLKKRKRQIMVSEIFNRHGINCILPIKDKNKYFAHLYGYYYLIYPYIAKQTIEVKRLSLDHISILAKLQSRIHSLRVVANIPFSYKKINIDFDITLKKLKSRNDVCELIMKNLNILEDLIKKCNENILPMKENFCISHNDYKPLNILWDNKEPSLLDFDAVGLVNPTCALCESAFTFSKVGKKIKYQNFEKYLESYIEEYGEIKEDFISALYVSMNGKLQWLSYLISKKRYDDVISMINELVLFAKNIRKFNEIYESIKN